MSEHDEPVRRRPDCRLLGDVGHSEVCLLVGGSCTQDDSGGRRCDDDRAGRGGQRRAPRAGDVQGTGRGKAKIYVDGVLNATVDTYAATRQKRVIVWDKALGKGTDQINVVNQATPGRPRVDIDAALTN